MKRLTVILAVVVVLVGWAGPSLALSGQIIPEDTSYANVSWDNNSQSVAGFGSYDPGMIGQIDWACPASPNQSDYDFRNLQPHREAQVKLYDLEPGISVQLNVCSANGLLPDGWLLDFMCDGFRSPVGMKDGHIEGEGPLVVIPLTITGNLVCAGQAFLIFTLQAGLNEQQAGIWGIEYYQL